MAANGCPVAGRHRVRAISSSSPDPTLSRLYRDARGRVTSLVTQLDDATLDDPVPACPAWSVRDVVSHLTAVVEDVMEGRLTGPPSDEQTAEQVARFRDRDLSGVLRRWDELAPSFEEMIDDFTVWPAVLDVASHEQDIRGAIGEVGARDTDVVRIGADRLLSWLQPSIPLRIEVEDAAFEVGPDGNQRIVLRTDRFEAFRWRLGRRSRAQLAAMDWAGDPSPILDGLVIFGPAATDIHE
jgi:uncharacterized protein (TIGR03083 family)